MTTKLEQAARRLKDLLIRPVDTIAEMYCYGMGDIDDAIKELKEALADHSGDANEMVSRPQNCGTRHCSCIECVMEPATEEKACSDHPDAPHGFDRNASHNAGHYVCDCEGWTPEEIK